MNAELRRDEAGFRLRGERPSRVDGFVDAAFAFAVTLLVVVVGRVPHSVDELVQAVNGVPAFAGSFILIAIFWQSHRRWSRRYGIEDDYSVRLSLALVFVILIYVYPLRMIAELAIGGPRTLHIHSVAELRELYGMYAIGVCAIQVIFFLLHRHALACQAHIDLSAVEHARTVAVMERTVVFAAVGALSLLLALLLPMGNAYPILNALPGIVYLMLVPLWFLLRHRERAKLALLDASTS